MTSVEQIAASVLYEGYILWPYRRSAQKNRQRWTFGGVYPPAFSRAGGGHDPWLMQTQCLVTGAAPVVQVQVRFLHVVDRQVGRRSASGALELVDDLHVGDQRHLSWEEAAERAVATGNLRLADLAEPRRVEVEIPAGSAEEPLLGPNGEPVGALVRRWRALHGTVEAEAQRVRDHVFRLTVRIANTAPWSGEDRAQTLQRTFVSTHTILRAEAGEFVSLLDPPAALQPLAAACENVKTWPVLVGGAGERHTLLSSPIILYDYPQVAPESPGDLFDGTEIDQLLLLNIMALTDEEKAEMRATDARARQILERSASLTSADFMNLHGAVRDLPHMAEPRDAPSTKPTDFGPHFAELERPKPQRVEVDGVAISRGSRVRLRPKRQADVFDIALTGKVAIVEEIEQDYDERIHLAVTLEDDPGRDLGVERQIGHRFFFAPDEVEPLDPPPDAPSDTTRRGDG